MAAFEETNPVLLHVFYGETVQDNVAGANGYPDIVLVTGVNGATRTVVKHISIALARLIHRERGVAIRQLDCGFDFNGESLTPRGAAAFGFQVGPVKSQHDVICRSGCQIHQAAAIVSFAFRCLNRMIAQRKAPAPLFLTGLTEFDGHLAPRASLRRRPVDTDAVERRNQRDSGLVLVISSL